MTQSREAFERWYDPQMMGDHSEKDSITRAYALAAWQAREATMREELREVRDVLIALCSEEPVATDDIVKARVKLTALLGE